MTKKGAITFAEGRYDYRTDVSIILNNGVQKKDFVIRTCLQSLAEWKSRYIKGGYPFKDRINGVTKDALVIDKEVWVFSIDATKANDIFTAVKIGMNYYKVRAEDILSDVYVKNLNAENENEMLRQVLVDANKNLYMSVCSAIIDAAKMLGCANTLNFWVFSNSTNYKIPKDDLYQALRDGGASDIESDEKTVHRFKVGDNVGGPGAKFLTHLHLAKLNLK